MWINKSLYGITFLSDTKQSILLRAQRWSQISQTSPVLAFHNLSGFWPSAVKTYAVGPSGIAKPEI